MNAVPRFADPLSADWIVLLLVMVFGTLTWMNMASPKKWKLIITSFFTFRLGRQSMREDVDLQDRTLIGLFVMCTAVIALFIYQVMVVRGILPAGVLQWARLFGLGLVVVFAQFLIIRAVSFLFQADGGTGEYVSTLVLIWIALGLFLVPVAVLITVPHHVPWRSGLCWIGLLGMAAVVLFRWIRALVIGVGEGVSLRYIFIYLCASEILPFALAAHHARQTVLP